MRKISIITVLLFIKALQITFSASPDEGMWIPMLIEKFNIRMMQEKGFKLSAEDIYSVNKACMKDAVILFGGGCTGAVISSEGLIITNHHCGYSYIQEFSTLEHDYLTDGYWAMSHESEIPCPGLFVLFLKRMEDVTDKVLSGTEKYNSDQEIQKHIDENIRSLALEAVEGTGYSSTIRPFYQGNQYFLFVYEPFSDIRFVGAPPSAIGKFGGDTDNWVWPRHTGDFSLFRIYADVNNKPAEYSTGNIPYKPLYHFPVSLKGISEGDFTMVFGYPGTTYEYVTSYHIDMVMNYLNPKMIALRGEKIAIIDSSMESDPLIRIQYSAKKSTLANSWKRWVGENQGLIRMKTLDNKREYEKKITGWIMSAEDKREEYGSIMNDYEKYYSLLKNYRLISTYTEEVFLNLGIEASGFSRSINSLINSFAANTDGKGTNEAKIDLLRSADDFFRNYNMETDKKLFVALLNMYGKNIELKWQAPEYIRLKNRCNGDFASIADKIYKDSYFTDKNRFISLVQSFTRSDIKKIKKDPLYSLAEGVNRFLSENVRGELSRMNSEIQTLNKAYMKLQMEYEGNRVFYPDANSTLRVAFGQIKGYESRDGISYRHFTTLKGIIEKDNPEIYDYDVPDKLKQLYISGDYGNYAQDGNLLVCFIADNHTTGGNSGSPVLNGEGHLVGLNFDRAWEGVASDMDFNPEQSRNISLDIRFALFIIDKFAGAGYLLNEMTLIK